MKNNYDVIIIGGGPAGITAGIYSVRYGLKTLIIEKYYAGGLMNTTTEIKNYPSYHEISGAELSQKMLEHYKSYDGDILLCEASQIDFEKKQVISSKGVFSFKTIIIATGSSPRKLELENERKLTGHGISYCAICDGYFFRGKNIAVIGSGNSAVEDAIYLSDICKTVNIVSKYKNFVAQDILVKQLKSKKNVKYFMGYMPSKINGNDSLNSIEIKNVSDNTLKNLKVDGMFIQIGHKPDNSLVKHDLDLSPAGFIISNEKMETNKQGVFVAGDIRNKSLRQIITACSDGAIASNSAYLYIQNLNEH